MNASGQASNKDSEAGSTLSPSGGPLSVGPLRPSPPPDDEGRAARWYLWDYDRCQVVRGPYACPEAAGAVRTEVEGDRNLWVVDGSMIAAWRRELDVPHEQSLARPQGTPSSLETKQP